MYHVGSEEDLLDVLIQAPKKKTEYAEAPDVHQLAEEIIEEYGLIDAGLARVKYLFKKADKSKFAGQCSLAGAKWKHLTGFDFVIEVWESWWASATPHQQKALVFHELSHIERSETRKGTKWSVRKHEIEAFLEEVQHFGPWSPELQRLRDITRDQELVGEEDKSNNPKV